MTGAGAVLPLTPNVRLLHNKGNKDIEAVLGHPARPGPDAPLNGRGFHHCPSVIYVGSAFYYQAGVWSSLSTAGWFWEHATLKERKEAIQGRRWVFRCWFVLLFGVDLSLCSVLICLSLCFCHHCKRVGVLFSYTRAPNNRRDCCIRRAFMET